LKEIDPTGSLRGVKPLFRKNTLPLSFEGEGDTGGEVDMRSKWGNLGWLGFLGFLGFLGGREPNLYYLFFLFFLFFLRFIPKKSKG
jgi:hypothetical protein